ncbi:MAG: T9SS type A sorting domain-containing protein [Aquaticitalea sp.]
MKLKLLSTFLLLFISTQLLSQVANQAGDIVVCDVFGQNDGIAIFDLTVNQQQILGSQSPNEYSISYHTSQTNANSGTNGITNATAYTNTSNPQAIYVRLTETSSGNFDTTVFNLSVVLSPVINQPSLVIVCDSNDDGTEVFDLTQLIPEILNGQSPNDFSVDFYFNGIIIVNPTGFNVGFNTSTFEVIVTDLIIGCQSTTFFDLILQPAPTAIQPTPLQACDTNGDGFAEFDLESKVAEITDGMTNGYVTFHLTQMDANASINPLISPFTNYVNPQIIYVRVEGPNGGCAAFVTLELQAIDCSDVGQVIVNAFLDINENSIFDTDENNFTNGYFTYEINNDGITRVVSSSTGQFILYSQNVTDSYDITYTLNNGNAGCYSVDLSSFDDIAASSGSVVNVEFPVIAADSCQDLAVYLYNPSTSPRPGFNYTNMITLQNLGNVTISSGTVEYLYDAQLQFNSVTSINSNYTVTPIAGGISIDFVDLLPTEIEEIFISLYSPTSITLGTLVTNVATYITPESDLYAVNNTSSLTQTVIGSYDPNDINESHGPKIVYDDFSVSDEFLYYLIRFQNVGTAEAINIRIEDVLDAQLDVMTFEMLLSSHDNVVTGTGNEFIWQFDDINLPSESMDAEGSNGFVYFKIKPQTGYAVGDIIPNVADIYFDFNAAITTNVFNTEFVETLSVDDFQSSNFTLYPNPANNSVSLQFSSMANGSVIIYDIQGKTILSNSFSNESRLQLNLSAFESGLYFVKLNTGMNETVKKLIVN